MVLHRDSPNWPIEVCINIKTAFLAYAFGKGAGGGGREKAYVSYACENAEKYGRSLNS